MKSTAVVRQDGSGHRAASAWSALGVPHPDAPWGDIEEYALACAPEAGRAELAHMASAARRVWTRYRQLPQGVEELRACLFFEQRRWHLFGAEPDGPARAYASALVLGIGLAVHATAEPTEPGLDGDCAEAG